MTAANIFSLSDILMYVILKTFPNFFSRPVTYGNSHFLHVITEGYKYEEKFAQQHHLPLGINSKQEEKMNTFSIVFALLASVAFTSAHEVVCRWGKGFNPTTITASIGVNGQTPKEFYSGSIGVNLSLAELAKASPDTYTFRGSVDLGSNDIRSAKLLYTSPSKAQLNIYECSINGHKFCRQLQALPGVSPHWVDMKAC